MNKKSLNELADINSRVAHVVQPTGPGAELDIFPWLRFIIPSSKESYKKVVEMIEKLDHFFKRELNHNKVTSIVCSFVLHRLSDSLCSLALKWSSWNKKQCNICT